MKFIGIVTDILEHHRALGVVEGSALEVGAYGYEIKDDSCLIVLRGYHYAQQYHIISDKKRTGHYDLTQDEAVKLIEHAADSDVIDLRTLGDYLIEPWHRIQTVAVTNTYDEEEDCEIPLIVSKN